MAHSIVVRDCCSKALIMKERKFVKCSLYCIRLFDKHHDVGNKKKNADSKRISPHSLETRDQTSFKAMYDRGLQNIDPRIINVFASCT